MVGCQTSLPEFRIKDGRQVNIPSETVTRSCPWNPLAALPKMVGFQMHKQSKQQSKLHQQENLKSTQATHSSFYPIKCLPWNKYLEVFSTDVLATPAVLPYRPDKHPGHQTLVGLCVMLWSMGCEFWWHTPRSTEARWVARVWKLCKPRSVPSHLLPISEFLLSWESPQSPAVLCKRSWTQMSVMTIPDFEDRSLPQ